MTSPNVNSDPSSGSLLDATSITTSNPNAELQGITSPQLNLNITDFRWSQTESEVTQPVEACFTIQNGQSGDKGTVKIYRQKPDGTQQNVAVLSFELPEKAGHLEMRIPWIPSDSIEVTPIEGDPGQTQDRLETLSPKTNPQSDHYIFEVTLGVHEFQDNAMKLLTLQKTVHLKPVYSNGEPLPPGLHFRIQYPSGEWGDTEISSETITVEKLALGTYPFQLMVPPSMSLGILSADAAEPLELLDSQYQHPYPIGLLLISSLKETQEPIFVSILPPFSGVNIREDSSTWKTDKPCSDLVIDNLKKNGNNVTLFLHGYNIPKGEWGYYYNEIQEKKVPTATILDSSGQTTAYQGQSMGIPCTIYRDERACTERFPTFASLFPLINNSIEKILHPFQEGHSTDALVQDQPSCLLHPNLQWDEEGEAATLNGTEGRRWGVEMEHNLNRAAGWDEKDYQSYSRIMPILWSGDFGALNFTEAVTHTARAGKRLTQLIRYLHDQGISEINVIAHSLGNEVLIFAMHELGNQNQTFLNHVFLWEPAVPQDALSSNPLYHSSPCLEITDPLITPEEVCHVLWYDFPKAYMSAKKITVLSSQNDNILGHLLSSGDCEKLKIDRTQVLKSKPFLVECLPAILLTELQLKSAFELAIWTRANPMDLFRIQKQDEIYEMFQQVHSNEPCRTTCVILEKKLDDQIALLERRSNFDAVDQGKGVSSFSQQSEPILYRYPDIAQKLADWEKTSRDIISFTDRLNHDFSDLLNVPYILFAGAEIILMSAAANELWKFLAEAGIASVVEDAVTIVAKGEKIKKYVQYTINHASFLKFLKRFLYLFHILFNEFPYQPNPAMGYEGIDYKHDKVLNDLYNKGQLVLVDQTLWLWSHAGMRMPSKELMEEVYKRKIWKDNPDYHFGKYRL